MFSSLKEKIWNVQEELTSSLKILKIDKHIPKPLKSPKPEPQDGINYDAGVELLERYKTAWTQLHKRTEITAACAYEADDLITKLHKTYEDQNRKANLLANTLANVPQLIHGVQEICDLILKVQCQMEETNEALGNLQDIVDTQELREKQLDHRFQLVVYQEKRQRELDDLKVKLMDEHLVKVKKAEDHNAKKLKERQAVFQEAFEEDLQEFKMKGSVSRLSNSSASGLTPSLEEIELDGDQNDLESFLEDESTADQVKVTK